MFIFVPTERYPEYCFTPGVVSQIPELVTNSIFAPVAACSKTVKFVPSRSTKERLSLKAESGKGEARAIVLRARPKDKRLPIEKRIFGTVQEGETLLVDKRKEF